MREQLNWYCRVLKAHAKRKNFASNRHRGALEAWGLLSAPADAAHYPILKSFQFAIFSAAAVSVPLLLLTWPFCTDQAAASSFGYLCIFLAGVGFFLGISEYWICLLKLVCKLTKSGHLSKLAANSDELFLSIHRRSFIVDATEKEIVERIIAALSSHPNMKINRLDICNGVVEAFLMSHKVVRTADFYFRLSLEESGAVKVDIFSRPYSALSRYSGEIMGQSLPILFDVEDAIKSSSQKCIINKKILTPPKVCLRFYQFALIELVCLFTLLSVIGAASGQTPNCIRFKAATMSNESNYAGALQESNKAVELAGKISDPEDRKSELAQSLNLRAQIVCSQFEDKFLAIKTSHNKPLVRLDGDTFTKASTDLATAIKSEPQWNGAYITKARLLGLNGDQTGAEKALTEAAKALESVDRPDWSSNWTDEQDLSYARAVAYAAQNDSLGALQYLQDSDYYYGQVGSRAAQLRVRLLTLQGNVNSHLTAALKDAKDDLRTARKNAIELDSGSMPEATDSSGPVQALLLTLAGTFCLLTYLLKDWYRVGAKDPFSAPAPMLYAARESSGITEDDDESDEPPHDSLAEQFDQLKAKMNESLSSIPKEQESTLDLGERVSLRTPEPQASQ